MFTKIHSARGIGSQINLAKRTRWEKLLIKGLMS